MNVHLDLFLFEGSAAFIGVSGPDQTGRPIMDAHFGFRDMSCGKLETLILGKTCAANAALGFSCLRLVGRFERAFIGSLSSEPFIRFRNRQPLRAS